MNQDLIIYSDHATTTFLKRQRLRGVGKRVSSPICKPKYQLNSYNTFKSKLKLSKLIKSDTPKLNISKGTVTCSSSSLLERGRKKGLRKKAEKSFTSYERNRPVKNKKKEIPERITSQGRVPVLKTKQQTDRTFDFDEFLEKYIYINGRIEVKDFGNEEAKSGVTNSAGNALERENSKILKNCKRKASNKRTSSESKMLEKGKGRSVGIYVKQIQKWNGFMGRKRGLKVTDKIDSAVVENKDLPLYIEAVKQRNESYGPCSKRSKDFKMKKSNKFDLDNFVVCNTFGRKKQIKEKEAQVAITIPQFKFLEADFYKPVNEIISEGPRCIDFEIKRPETEAKYTRSHNNEEDSDEEDEEEDREAVRKYHEENERKEREWRSYSIISDNKDYKEEETKFKKEEKTKVSMKDINNSSNNVARDFLGQSPDPEKSFNIPEKDNTETDLESTKLLYAQETHDKGKEIEVEVETMTRTSTKLIYQPNSLKFKIEL